MQFVRHDAAAAGTSWSNLHAMPQATSHSHSARVLGIACALASLLLACGPSGNAPREVVQPALDMRPAPGADARETSMVAPDGNVEPPPPDAPAADVVVPADMTTSDNGGGTPDADVKQPVGKSCTLPQDCQSGFCVDRVCCATACTGRCFVCNHQGTVGTCTAVPGGEDPRNECAPDPVITCGRDGTCDGAGTCRLYPAKTECEPGGCFGTTMEKSARLCDGGGVCQAATTRSCTSTACMNGSCGSSCNGTTACLPGFFCDASTCKLKRALGDNCTAGAQCASGNCVGGICCDTACDKACYSCKQASKPGTCLPVPNGDDPGDKCAAEGMDTCKQDGACDGSGACRLWGQGTECGAASCTAGVGLSPRACDGRGTCSAAARTECGAFACAGTKCGTTCSDVTGCAPGATCSGNTCTIPPPSALALRWTFDEETGLVAADASGNTRPGTYAPMATPPTPSTEVPMTTFANPRSRQFDREKDQVVQIVPLPPDLRTVTELTIALFYKAIGPVAASDGYELVSLSDNHLLRLVKGGGFEVTKATSDKKRHKCTAMVAAAIDNKWHHVATTIDPSGIKLYFDGALQTCTFTPQSPLPVIALGGDLVPDGNFTVGRHGKKVPETQYDFTGNIDDVRVYWRALNAAEVKALSDGAP